jgi:hypothetical protein
VKLDPMAPFSPSDYEEFFWGHLKDRLGNPIVADWCPNQPCPFLPGPTHKHSLILLEHRDDYMRLVIRSARSIEPSAPEHNEISALFERVLGRPLAAGTTFVTNLPARGRRARKGKA